ncbi:MAG: CPBP family intramembrane glutamic endopeptidase [Anaerolineae bacterium]
MASEELHSIYAILLTPIFKWIPGIIAIYFSYKERMVLKFFKKPQRIDLWAGLLGLIIPLLAFLLSLPFTSLNSMTMSLPKLGALLFLVMPCNIFFALGEEVLWRGYFYEKTVHWNFLKQSLVIGCIWGFWHLPLISIGFDYPGHLLLGTCLMLLLTTGLSPVFLYYRLAGESLLAPTLLHGIFNTFAVFLFAFFAKPTLLVGGAGFIGAGIAWIFFIIYTQKLKNKVCKSE